MSGKKSKKEIAIIFGLSAFVLITGFFLSTYLRLASAVYAISSGNIDYLTSTTEGAWALLVFVLLIIILMFVINYLHLSYLLKPLYLVSIISNILSVFGMLISDLIWMFAVVSKSNVDVTFNDMLNSYLAHEWWLYALFLVLTGVLAYILQFFATEQGKALHKKTPQLLLLLPLVLPLMLLPYILNAVLFIHSNNNVFNQLKSGFIFSFGYLLLLGLLWAIVLRLKNRYELQNKFFIKFAGSTAISTVIALFIPLFSLLFINKAEVLRNGLSGWQGMKLFNNNILDNSFAFIPIFFALALSAILRLHFRKQQFNEENKDTSGKFGSAKWATKNDLKRIKAYDPNNGAIIGADDEGALLYLPFTNKLTLAPPGSGKTVSSSIPILLEYNGPAFVFDIKGELWATTARYRSEVMKRTVIVIDPYRVTKEADFTQGKPANLLIEHRINPFDFIPKEEEIRDRMINAFASSFIISDDVRGGGARHFDENARILIRGFIDHMMKTFSPEKRNLAALYDLLSENSDKAQATFKNMSELSGRAAAASNQVNRVGSNERGSILSTSYRQIDWMSDSNMQWALSASDFNLRDFLQGNMDIFIVIPEDQVKEHGRLIRMLMSLLMGIIVQANPSELPKNKMLFLLDEVAQLGYCPDVEQCIEVLRARGVVVWTVFQSLSQIEMFHKPDLFKGVPLKQIFTQDDVPTMEWIQALGGKTTVVNKTLSSNKGDSRHKMQTFGGTVSQGLSESVQETASNLIQTNEIREMPIDDQFIFLHGQKPIRCKKIRYFDHPFFAGRFDLNPVETKGRLEEGNKND